MEWGFGTNFSGQMGKPTGWPVPVQAKGAIDDAVLYQRLIRGSM